MAVSVDPGELQVGVVLASPVCDADGTKLLSAGVEITAPFLQRLQARGIRAVRLHEEDLPLLQQSQESGSADAAAQSTAEWTAPCSSQLLRALSNLARQGNAANLSLDLIREGALLIAKAMKAEFFAYSTPRSEERLSFFIGRPGDRGPLNCNDVSTAETQSLAGFLHTQDHAVLIDDLLDESRFADRVLESLQLRTCCAAPIRVDGCQVGTIAALTAKQRTLSPDDALLADTVSEIIALGVRGGDWQPRKQLGVQRDGSDRRRHRRFQYVRTLNVAPFREGAPPGWGECQMVVCTDLSVSGLCYLDNNEPRQDVLFVGLGSPPAIKYFKAKVINVRPTQVNGWPMFAVGCSLVERLD